jgi:large subunit ribosomal protein L1
MPKQSKRFSTISKGVDRESLYALKDGISRLKENATAKFDESVDIAVRLGVDPRKADQNIRGTVSLPHGSGKSVRVLVVAREGQHEEARQAGADFVGYTDVLEKISGGWTDFDVVIAAPDVMGDLGKLGRILGPRGLMPNPKAGTVTADIATAVSEVKAGKIEFRVDKTGVVHASVGKASFDQSKLAENIRAFMNTINAAKPQSSKGKYVKSVTISSTMGPGIPIDAAKMAEFEATQA